MQIFVKTITGETITLVNVEETVDSVKERIAEIEGVPVAQQRLIYSGREMEDGRPLSFYNMQEDSTIHMMLSLPGGTIQRHLRQLAQFYVENKKICRKCYGRLPPNATRCRKVKCGRTDNIRHRKMRCGRTYIKKLSDWNKNSSPEYLWCVAHYEKLLNDEKAGKLSMSPSPYYIGPNFRSRMEASKLLRNAQKDMSEMLRQVAGERDEMSKSQVRTDFRYKE